MGEVSPDLMQFQRSAHLYITLVLWARCQTAREAPQSQRRLCKNSSALIHNPGSANVCLSPCLCRAAAAQTALLNGHFDFLFAKDAGPEEEAGWAHCIQSTIIAALRFFHQYWFSITAPGWENRRTGQLYPSASSSLLLEVPYCSTAFYFIFFVLPNS